MHIDRSALVAAAACDEWRCHRTRVADTNCVKNNHLTRALRQWSFSKSVLAGKKVYSTLTIYYIIVVRSEYISCPSGLLQVCAYMVFASPCHRRRAYKSKLVYYVYNIIYDIIFSSQMFLRCRGTRRRTVVAAAVVTEVYPPAVLVYNSRSNILRGVHYMCRFVSSVYPYDIGHTHTASAAGTYI